MPSSCCGCVFRLRKKGVFKLFASVSNHRCMTIKVSGTMSVAIIHHQYVIANSNPSGLKKIVLKKDCPRAKKLEYGRHPHRVKRKKNGVGGVGG